MALTLGDGVRAHGARIATEARSVRIHLEALQALEPGPAPELDPQRHYLEGAREDVADYLLVLDTINFGSGWFPTLRKRTGSSGYFTVAWSLADRWRAGAGWTPAQLRALRTEELADTLGQARDHELMALYAQALRELGRFLRGRRALDVVHEAGRSALRLAETLATSMTMWHDVGFYKRAQIAASDLSLGGVASFDDIDQLTIFADNLVPHVLRCEGVLVYDDGLAAHIDAGRLLRPGPQEREIRGCAVHACAAIAQRTGLTERDLDNALWYRGQRPEYKARPRHRCRTIYY
jgi:sulfur relay (sulfurtransferase) complex TusBCD TusD component (DsrE family)